MASVTPHRAHFQELADLVHRHAAAGGWPEITYQAAFITVVHAGTNERWLEGNSIYWNQDWDANAEIADHPVRVSSGEEAWCVFLEAALYPVLLRADAELLVS